MLGFGAGIELEAGCGGGRNVECGDGGTEFKSGAMVITMSSISGNDGRR
jgi:hypothetical protein